MASNGDTTPLISEVLDSQQDLHSDHLDSLSLSHQQAPSVTALQNSGGRCGALVRVLKSITIEPVLFLYISGWMVQASVTTNLLLTKICRELKYSEEICSNLTYHGDAQAEVQARANTLNMYLEIITNIPSVLFVLFLGSWSDKHGRKIPMLLPIIGSLLSTIIYLGNVYWMELPALYILLAAVPRALTGGLTTILMSCYSYISDISKLESRTMRIAFLDLSFALGPLIGLVSSDVLFYETGYLGVYGVSGLFFLLSIAYGVIRIEDTRGRFSKYHMERLELTQQPGNICRDLLDTGNVKDTFKTAVKPRPNKGRAKVLLLTASLCSIVFVFSHIDYLYVKRKFGWDYNQYIQLAVVDTLLTLTGTSIILPVCSFKFKIADSLLALVGALSSIAGFITRGLAPYPWVLYFSYVVGCIGGMPIIITRSLISKYVPEEELGKIFSMVASWESVIPLLSSPLYTLVYNASIYNFPGAMYIMSAGFYLLPVSVFIWIYHDIWSSSPSTHIHQETVPEITS